MAPLTPENSKRALQRLSAGRVRAMDKQPYMSKSLMSMLPIAREGFGTFAVDKRWRMYYDPQLCLDWSVDEIAAAWLHECSHLVRSHAQRFETIEGKDGTFATQWNHAADAAINSDLKEINVVLADPDNRFYASSNSLYPEWKQGMTTEQMFSIARGRSGKDEQPPGSGGEEESQKGDNSEDSENDGESSNAPDDSNQDPSEDKDSKDPDEDTLGESSSGGETAEKEEGEEDSGSSSESGVEEGEDSGSEDTQDGTSEEGSDGTQDGTSSDDSDESEEQPETGCGSGAIGGPSKDYEENDIDDGSLDPFDADQVREETARDIMDASKAGTVPAGLVRSADEILNPKVDWQRELSRWMRRTVAQVIGQTDYSFSRRSRASLMTPFYLPGLRDREPPVVKVVLDTSGSMQPEDLARGISEICAILQQSQRNSGTAVELINCDAGVHSTELIRDISQITIRGGGGTDMRIGMKIAAQARPAADVVIIITDGGTPWMDAPPAENMRAKYVVLLVEQKNGGNMESIMSRIPQWMEVIPTYR